MRMRVHFISSISTGQIHTLYDSGKTSRWGSAEFSPPDHIRLVMADRAPKAQQILSSLRQKIALI